MLVHAEYRNLNELANHFGEQIV
uniref:Uncharacterized protein n=1 Tax=Arundo donax TaxID=35708 RepID=A0A0A8XRA4_ARUDO